MNTTRKRGFTLIELIIAVSIILILAAIAIPNYRGHVMRSNRSDAMAALLQVAAAQEKFYMQNNTYTTVLGAGGLGLGGYSSNNHYTITIQAGADADGFVAVAAPNPNGPGSQVNDTHCTEFRIDQEGNKSASGAGADHCWR